MRALAKVLRVAAKTALVVLAVVALLVGVTWSFLQTRRGGELVRRIALPRVNAALAGTLTLERFAFGGDRVTLENAVLYDPDGQFVGRVARVDVWFSPFALLRRHIDVRAVDIRRPELALVQDERGLNLTRAIASPHAKPAAPAPAGGEKGGASRIAIDVRALAVTGGAIDYRGDGQQIHVADVSIHGNGSLAGARAAAETRIRVRGGHVEARGAFDGETRRGHADVRAGVRGVALTAGGSIDGDRIAARARIDATDLAVTARALARDFGLERIPISGHGHVDVEGGGTLATPSLRVSARFPAVGFDDKGAKDLQADAQIPDLGAPDALELAVRAASVSLGPQQILRSPALAARTIGRRVSAHAAIAAPQPLSLDVAGTRAAGDRRSFTVEALEVRYPDGVWTLRRRARLSLTDGLVLSGLELGADAQRLAVDLRAVGDERTAHVVVSRLDLGRLPRALVASQLGLGGVVDADVRLQDGARPRVVATAKLAGGRIRGHRDLSVDLKAKVERGRAHGSFDARAPGIAASARFDLPGEWPPRNPRAPIALDVDLAETDLAMVAKTVADAQGGKAPHVAGKAKASLKLDGRVGQPRVQVDLSGRGLAFGDRRIGDLAVSMNGEGDGKLAARLTSTAPVRARIDLTADLSVTSLLRRPPTAEALARTSFEIEGAVERLALADVARIAGYPARVGGTLSSKLSVTGTPAEPRGTVEVDVTGATAPRFPATDARVELDFDGGAVGARARIVRERRPLLALQSRVGVPLGRLIARERLADAPIELRVVLGPYVVQRLGLQAESEREAERALKGKLHADLTADGTLGAPRVLFHAQASDVYLDKMPVGYARIEARYADRAAKLDAQLTSANGGGLHAIAALKADLGYPAVTRGLDLRTAPLDARLEAQQFELRGLSGVVAQLRTIAGLLTASLTARGTPAAPRLDGRLEWKDGVLGVTDFGEYKQIHLTAHGNDTGVVLDELTAKSGSGHARVTGRATRAGANAYEVSADLKLDHLPLYQEGQPLAVVSLTSRLQGHASLPDAKLNVDIDEARIELPDTQRRKLQSLKPPRDVVLMDGDMPLNRAQAAKLKALKKGESEPPRAPAARPNLRLQVNSPRQLWVTGKDAYLELGLSPKFKVAIGADTQVFGQVTVLRGRVDVFGRRFDIKADSTLTFGGSPDHPDLDVRAEHVNTTENVTVLLTAKGPIDKLAVTVTSPNRPDLSESQLYTMIVSGHLQLGSGPTGASSPTGQAASILGGVLAGQLQAALKDRLPFDVLTIDVGGQGIGGTKLEAGRYLTDRLYVGYIGRIAADPSRYQNRNAVHLEFQITSRWEIEAEYGDLGTGTGDLIWKKNY